MHSKCGVLSLRKGQWATAKRRETEAGAQGNRGFLKVCRRGNSALQTNQREGPQISPRAPTPREQTSFCMDRQSSLKCQLVCG